MTFKLPLLLASALLASCLDRQALDAMLADMRAHVAEREAREK
ncbi:MAG TPA: hypothetical protein VJ484_00990 [Lysobacter sp.]|nr:hypothetical protein [Lysobacter sp.]